MAVAVAPPLQKQTLKKEPIVVQFSTLTRSARKRQQEEMMRDVETEMGLNRKKEESTETPSAPVKGAPVKCLSEEPSGAPVMTEP